MYTYIHMYPGMSCMHILYFPVEIYLRDSCTFSCTRYLTHTYTCTQVCHVCIFYIFLFMYLRYVQRSKRNVKGADNDFSVECVRICFRCYLVYARQHLLPSGKLERSLLLSSVHFFHHISKLFSLRSASMISCCHSLFHGSDLLRMLRSVSFQRLQLQLVDIFNIS